MLDNTIEASAWFGRTAIITGASSGIGRAFAQRLATLGCNVVLVARSEDRLQELAEELAAENPIAAHVLAADLSTDEGVAQLIESLGQLHLDWDLLVNNAGFGKWEFFPRVDWDGYQTMLHLNINALVALSQFAAKRFLERGAGDIINVSSLAAFAPVPYAAVYSASKSFVLYFSEAIASELKDHGIRVLALCPGGTSTGFFEVATAHDVDESSFDSPETVVEEGLAALLRGETVHVVAEHNRTALDVSRNLPRQQLIDATKARFKTMVESASLDV